ncbi:MAG TPA: DUF3987 domain-containing protein, partial [Sphingomonas sp.]|nr:DUF3987 domain-containing protein [Sphingomonas sp.]
ANVMWDGGVIHQERMSREATHVEDMRVTMGLQVQPAVLASFVQKTGGLAKGIGYLARFLFSQPQTTQGSRYYAEPPADMPALRAFQRRMAALLAIEPVFDDLDRLMPDYVCLDPYAYEAWYRFHDEVEEQMGDGQPFEGIRDVASKAADNAVRLACCLHVFSGDANPQITKQAMVSACSLMRWYLDEAVRFARARDMSEAVSHAQLLEEWLVREVKRRGREGSEVLVAVNEARQKGPNKLRERAKMDAAIELLSDHGRVRVFRRAGAKGLDILLAPAVLREYS